MRKTGSTDWRTKLPIGLQIEIKRPLAYHSKRNSASSIYSVPVVGRESEPDDIGPVPADVVMLLGSLS
ncbi:hypothetical protein [Frankia sp. Cj5]|uniref:hypothetical protein n=1 Tax=Frankia sp. Cj5 TaxID=2880978 RepID=UPI001EF71E9B|nr:hypothetical protein [Frankia sp. Cj5]